MERVQAASDHAMVASKAYAEAPTNEGRLALRKPLRAARLELHRALSANANRDLLPPEQAAREHVALLWGNFLLTQLTGAFPQPKDEDGFRMHAMLLSGALHHRERHWVGAPGESKPPLFYRGAVREKVLQTAGAHAFRDPLETEDGKTLFRGTKKYTVGKTTASGYIASSTVAHEVRHGVQANGSGYGNPQKFAPRRPEFTAGDSPLGGSLEASTSLPVPHNPSLGEPQPALNRMERQEVYFTKPWEVDAFSEEAVNASLMADSAFTNRCRLGGCGLELLKPLLSLAAGKLDTWNPVEKNLLSAAHKMAALTGVGEESLGGKPVVRLETGNSSAAPVMEELSKLLTSLNQLAGSEAWKPEDSRFLKELMKEKAELLSSNWARGLSGVEHTQEIVNLLREFHNEFIESHGLMAAIPAGETEVTRERYEANKADPWARLQTQLDSTPDPRRAAETYEAFESAKWNSGFMSDVKALKDRIGAGQAVEAAAIQRAIVKLAGELSGIDPSRWPASLTPEIDLYEPPSDVVPIINGHNTDAAGQKRKIAFVAQNLQFHVPSTAVEDTEKLEARLSSMAAKMAYTAMDIMVHHRNKPMMVNIGGLQAGYFAGMMNEVTEDLGAISAEVLGQIQTNPKSAAAQTHRAIMFGVPNTNGKQWQDGPRAAVKSAAASGDTQAEAVFLAQAYQRSNNSNMLPVCYTQTVKGAPLSQEQREKFQTLSPAAKVIAQTAALMGDDFDRNVMISVDGNKVMPTDWAALHEAGFLKDGKIASRQMVSFMKRIATPAFRDEITALKATLREQSAADSSKALITERDMARTRVSPEEPSNPLGRAAEIMSPDSADTPFESSLWSALNRPSDGT
jgi:hypothetical protein